MFLGHSKECCLSELDLFTLPDTQTSVEGGITVNIQPHPNISTGPIQFDIPPDVKCYLDPSQTILKLRCYIKRDKKGDEGYMRTDSNIGPVNNLLHSMFSQCEVSINGSKISNSNGSYAYEAYISNLLNYSAESKGTHLTNELWYSDSPGQFENLAISNEDAEKKKVLTNRGFLMRRERCAVQNRVDEKHIFEMSGPIFSDIFKTNKYLPNNVEINIKLTRSKDSFCLMGTDENFRIYVEEALLQVRKVFISPSVMHAHALAFEKSNAKYPFKHVEIKPISMPLQTKKTTLSTIHNGTVPSRVIIGFVDTEAYVGSYTSNPFNFQNFTLESLGLKVSSQSEPYSEPLLFNYEKFAAVEGYSTLFKNEQFGNNGITYNDYINGCALYSFDLTPDQCSNNHFNLLREGNLELEIIFNKTPQKSITGILFLEFDSVLEINQKRQVILLGNV
jgi:hypothetical protein